MWHLSVNKCEQKVWAPDATCVNHLSKLLKQKIRTGKPGKFRHLKDPYFILCGNTKEAYRIRGDKREDPFHWISLDRTCKMTNNYIEAFSVATSVKVPGPPPKSMHGLCCKRIRTVLHTLWYVLCQNQFPPVNGKQCAVKFSLWVAWETHA